MVQGGSAKLFAQTQLPEDLIEDPAEDLVEKKDNDSVMDLAEIAELDAPSRFHMDDWKAISVEIMPSRSQL